MAFLPKHLQISHSEVTAFRTSVWKKLALAFINYWCSTIIFSVLNSQNSIFCKSINDPIAKHWPEVYMLVEKYVINYGLCKFPNYLWVSSHILIEISFKKYLTYVVHH